MWQSLLINLGVSLVKSYIESSESKKDDKVLEVIQEGAKYLSNKGNNNVQVSQYEQLNDNKMVPLQKSTLAI